MPSEKQPDGPVQSKELLDGPADKSISSGCYLTVIIRDDSPMIFCGDGPAYRSVMVPLTEEQMAQMRLKFIGQSGAHRYHESVSRCFLE